MQETQKVIVFDAEPDASLFERNMVVVRKGNIFQFSMICDPKNWNPEILGHSVDIKE